MAQEMSKGHMMKAGWKTHAIGRHLVDVPGDAKLVESWKYNQVSMEKLPTRSDAHFKQIIERREAELRETKQKKHGTLFVERVQHSQGSVTLVSWSSPTWDGMYFFDSYFRTGMETLKYSGGVSLDRKQIALERRERYSHEWHEIKPGEIPEGVGFVAGDMILANPELNKESWTLAIQLANKADVSLEISSFVVGKVDPEQTLRKRAGGIVAGMLGMGLGLVRLRNHERPVGPIWAEEILVAGTQKGKRSYGFKWEAPGKANSLAEPQLNVELEVGESAYTTNAQSFANDEEALALWDAIVDSIRLRPGAV